mmetsp:Transcript_12626/g.17038  ORF Transcript_12626/g.17038 Transcript_12626/m.17038 type:complete len:116 (-) Transcript_12626:37-384(-)
MYVVQDTRLDVEGGELAGRGLLGFLVAVLVKGHTRLGQNSKAVPDQQLSTPAYHLNHQKLSRVVQGGFRANFAEMPHAKASLVHHFGDFVRAKRVLLDLIQILDELGDNFICKLE